MYMNYAFFRGDLTSHVVDSILKSPLCANSEPEISDSLVDSDLSLKILHPKLTDCWLPPPFVSWYIVKVRSQDADCVLFCNVSWSSQPHAEPTQFLAKWQLWKSTNQQNNAILEKLRVCENSVQYTMHWIVKVETTVQRFWRRCHVISEKVKQIESSQSCCLFLSLSAGCLHGIDILLLIVQTYIV